MNKHIIKQKLLLYKIRKNKDPESFALLYDIFVEKIYRYIFFKVNKAEDAEDLTSEVFLKTWQYLITDKKVGNFNALVYQIAKHIIVDFYRKKSQAEFTNEEDLLLGIEENKSLADQIEKKLEFENVGHLLKKLKDEYREVIILRFVEELSIDEIAKIISKTKGNVRVMLHRALSALKELIEKHNNK